MEAHAQGFWDLGWALSLAGRYEEALSQLRPRGRDRPSHRPQRLHPRTAGAQLHPLIQLGRLPQAIAVGEEAVEAAWTSGDPMCASAPTGTSHWPGICPATRRRTTGRH